MSSVIKTVYPKKSWDTEDPKVMARVEHARIRGVRVDTLLTEYVRTGNVTMDPSDWQETEARLERCIKWWDKNVNGSRVETQKILYSEADGIAGTADFVLDGEFVIDLKNSAKLEASYQIQIGGYSEYQNAKRAAVLHSTDKAVKLVPYDVLHIRGIFQQARSWYACVKRLEGGF
jgi:hypothetical protein